MVIIVRPEGWVLVKGFISNHRYHRGNVGAVYVGTIPVKS